MEKWGADRTWPARTMPGKPTEARSALGQRRHQLLEGGDQLLRRQRVGGRDLHPVGHHGPVGAQHGGLQPGAPDVHGQGQGMLRIGHRRGDGGGLGRTGLGLGGVTHGHTLRHPGGRGAPPGTGATTLRTDVTTRPAASVAGHDRPTLAGGRLLPRRRLPIRHRLALRGPRGLPGRHRSLRAQRLHPPRRGGRPGRRRRRRRVPPLRGRAHRGQGARGGGRLALHRGVDGLQGPGGRARHHPGDPAPRRRGRPGGPTAAPEFGGVNYTHTKINGTTRNPWNPERTPGGSSGGSAAAVAGGLVPIATGGDGGGSIRIPAGYTGLFGLKSTFGRIPKGPAHPAAAADGGARVHGPVGARHRPVVRRLQRLRPAGHPQPPSGRGVGARPRDLRPGRQAGGRSPSTWAPRWWSPGWRRWCSRRPSS